MRCPFCHNHKADHRSSRALQLPVDKRNGLQWGQVMNVAQDSVYHIRKLNHASTFEIELVAARMRATLEEVLGAEQGGTMYTMAWLINRVRQHIDGDLNGEVLLAEDQAGQIIGHTIVRLDLGRVGDTIGLFSTIYVVPAYRRQAVASQLIQSGEAWMAAHGLHTFATYTSVTNTKLIHLFQKHGYRVAEHIAEKEMVIIEKSIAL